MKNFVDLFIKSRLSLLNSQSTKDYDLSYLNKVSDENYYIYAYFDTRIHW